MKGPEAEERARETNLNRKFVFCPLGGRPCNPKCECYQPAYVHEYKGEYTVLGGYCTAYILHGPAIF